MAELIKRAPVDVKIASVDIAKDGNADIKVRLGKNTTTAPERITLYINGAQVLTEAERELKGAKPGDILKYTAALFEKKNHIRVTVENQWAENSHETTVESETKGSQYGKGTLYVVAAGISHYPELPLEQQLKSPPLDARGIAAQLQKLEGTLYKKVDIKILTDDRNTIITSDMVEKALREQTEKAGALDTTILFLAGHGVTDAQGSYHFVTADTKILSAWGEQLNMKQGTSLDWKRLHSILDKTMGRRVVFVDTCQAGEVFSDNKTDIKRLVKDIHDVNAIVYSGTSRQDAGVETSKGGVFTLSMLSGFDGKAAYDGNILPFTRLRDYVDKEVPRLNRDIMLGLYRDLKIKQTKEEDVNFDGVQKPVAVMPTGMERFIIYAR
ncbi:MAG: caspase family protein [Nitrospirae bacterium]|nr:caspase family protein [Nitrospirota bacterium]